MSAPNDPPLPKEFDQTYNTVFERLQRRTGQVPSAIAYALYKVAKREWIEEFVARNGRRPAEADYSEYAATQTDAVLDAYIAQAEQILGAYAQAVVEDSRPEILQQALEGSFRRSFWPSFWASAAFAIFVAIVAVIAAVSGIGLPVEITIPDAAG